MTENEEPKKVEKAKEETQAAPAAPVPAAPLTLEEFGERVKVAGLNPMRDALNEYVSRIRAIGKSFLEALENPPKKD